MANWVAAQLKYKDSKENFTPEGDVIDGTPFYRVRRELTSCCSKRWPPNNSALDLEYRIAIMALILYYTGSQRVTRWAKMI